MSKEGRKETFDEFLERMVEPEQLKAFIDGANKMFEEFHVPEDAYIHDLADSKDERDKDVALVWRRNIDIQIQAESPRGIPHHTDAEALVCTIGGIATFLRNESPEDPRVEEFTRTFRFTPNEFLKVTGFTRG